jgi:hypothetical protein
MAAAGLLRRFDLGSSALGRTSDLPLGALVAPLSAQLLPTDQMCPSDGQASRLRFRRSFTEGRFAEHSGFPLGLLPLLWAGVGRSLRGAVTRT